MLDYPIPFKLTDGVKSDSFQDPVNVIVARYRWL